MMPRLDTNRAAEMEVFVRVVDLGGFTAAAREFRLTPSGVSKLVSRLEGRLSARLINRSTRRLQLTPEGQAFYDRAVRVLSDIDLMQERADIAIRVGPLRDSSLVARKLGTSRMAVVASPEYIAKHGVPKTPDDLSHHKGIGWTFFRTIGGWPFQIGETTESASPPPVARASDGEAARLLALGGAGLARLALFHIGADIEAGRLVPVLEEFNT